MEGQRKVWLKICVLLGIVVYLLILWFFLPWRVEPQRSIQIWTPANYAQVSGSSQALLAKNWLERKATRANIGPEAFQATKFQTTYIFGTPDLASVDLTYLGAVEEGPVFYYNERVRAAGFNYLVQGNPVIDPKTGTMTIASTTADWVFAILFIGFLGALIILGFTLVFYEIGVDMLKRLRKSIPAPAPSN